MRAPDRLPAASVTARGVPRDLRKVPADSERLLWSVLRDRRLDGLKFRRQQPAEDFVLDFYCQELMLAIEVDGAYHDLTASKDAHRQRFFEDRGIRFIRVLAEYVERNREAVVNYIRAEIRSLPSPAHGRGMSAEGGLGEGRTR